MNWNEKPIAVQFLRQLVIVSVDFFLIFFFFWGGGGGYDTISTSVHLPELQIRGGTEDNSKIFF